MVDANMERPANIYLELTRLFNRGRFRAVICSGQATVLHRLAIMSKDGDWILREDEESLAQVRGVLGSFGARYRFGAPLDIRWLRHGWSAHFEFTHGKLRVRADFFTRPPRLSETDLAQMWGELIGSDLPFVNLRHLAILKMTNREKDYATIGEIARRMSQPRDQILFSRSARDLLRLRQDQPLLFSQLAPDRPALEAAAQGMEALQEALDRERRQLIRANERRLAIYAAASEQWRAKWQEVAEKIAGRPLEEAHSFVVENACDLLPMQPVVTP